jgi:threonyl-tRNA synthetase
VGEAQLDYAKDVAAKMRAIGIRAEVDTSGDRLAKLIRNAEKEKIPVMAVVGAKEVETNTLSIRTRASGELGTVPVPEILDKMKQAIANYDNL